jgi:uncharacterized SAM-binding protein YcdF (DUF218 family)
MAAAFICLILAALFLAPRWLLYSDPPAAADTVVLFVGPGFEDRLTEARRLVREGYARSLLIPAYHGTFRRNDDGHIVSVGGDFIEKFFPAVRVAIGTYPACYEETHVETLEARRLMDARGFRSALFVSSPYHMRRIRMICGKVFDPGRYAIRFVPAQALNVPRSPLLPDLASIRWQTSEYLKIGWFLVYSVIY